MTRELNLGVNSAYSHAVLAFFPPYIALELFSNIGMRKAGARIWLPTAALLWSVALIGMGFVKNASGLIALRAVVGVFEAALFPGATYLLGCWYLRTEIAWRLTAFYMVGVFASGVAAILAYGFAQVRTGTVVGWRWIFIGEGLISVAAAAYGYWRVVDFPSSHRCTFLDEHEKEIVATRINRDRADANPDAFTWAKAGRYALDFKLWIFALCFGATTLASYALSYFAPQIIISLGITVVPREIYALLIPPYAAALPWGLLMARLSDRTRLRSPFIALNALICILGLGLFAFLPRNRAAGRYIGLFITAAACNSNVPLVSSYSQTAIRMQSKRAWTSALVVGFGGLGGIVSALVFREHDAPQYRFGIIFTMACQAVIFVCMVSLGTFFMFANKQAARGKRVLEGHPEFRYQI